MRKLVFVVLVSFLLVALAFVQRGNIPAVKAASSIYQGDLVLTGNNVTTIENQRFDINGSIIVQGNATLVLNDAVINFTQESHYQFNITLMNPDNGNPRLIVDNATIVSNYWQKLFLNEGSLANFNDTTFDSIGTANVHSSNVSMSYSRITSTQLYFYGSSKSNIFNSSVNGILAYDNSNITVQNSTISRVLINPHQVNFTANELRQGLLNYWKFRLNCSVIQKLGGSSPDLTFINTQVNSIALLFTGASEVTIISSKIDSFNPYGSTIAWVYNSTFTYGVVARINAKIYIYNSTIEYEVESQNNAKVWLVNSTSNRYDTIGQSKIFISWYLRVLVVDSINQSVPNSEVTAFFPNASIAESQRTNINGLAKLTLMEKMMNITGEYPTGNYTVEATYGIHSNNTLVTMTGNQQITIKLQDFIIPEFPSFLIMPLFMIATLLVALAYKKKQSIRPMLSRTQTHSDFLLSNF